MEKFEELKEFISELESDFEKFYQKNNKTAGTRVRQSMQKLKTIAQDIRVDILDKIKS